MGVTFAVNVVVLLYNVFMKRLEGQGKVERVQRMDRVLRLGLPLVLRSPDWGGDPAVLLIPTLKARST